MNKQIVAESIISLGLAGVQSLLDKMQRESHYNYKTKEYIAKALATAPVSDSNIGSVIELLFALANDPAPVVRKACLVSLSKLRVQASRAISYLKSRSLLPFMYQFLADVDHGVRQCAVAGIRGFGPQGELLFIEGATKDTNPIVRRECVLGLGVIGATTFRTLLLVLHDSCAAVRQAAAEAICNNMTPEAISACFK